MAVSSMQYADILMNCSSYNRRLKQERRMRLPFIESQTSVAQNVCSLWRSRLERVEGEPESNVVCWYPPRKYKKRKQTMQSYYRTALIPRDTLGLDAESREDYASRRTNGDDPGENSNFSDSTVPAVEGWYGSMGLEEISEPEYDAPSDDEYYEEPTAKKKRKRAPGTGKSGSGAGASTSAKATGNERPYQCKLCGSRYKTKPGLSYHMQHSVHNPDGTVVTRISSAAAASAHAQIVTPEQLAAKNAAAAAAAATTNPPGPIEPGSSSLTSSPSTTASGSLDQAGIPPSGPGPDGAGFYQRPGYPAPAGQGSVTEVPMPPNPLPQKVEERPPGQPFAHPQPGAGDPSTLYCDFCFGSAAENKKTGRPELLIQCKDCGRAGHPSCLQFQRNMVASTQKYGWQCIECKSCAICGTSENDSACPLVSDTNWEAGPWLSDIFESEFPASLLPAVAPTSEEELLGEIQKLSEVCEPHQPPVATSQTSMTLEAKRKPLTQLLRVTEAIKSRGEFASCTRLSELAGKIFVKEMELSSVEELDLGQFYGCLLDRVTTTKISGPVLLEVLRPYFKARVGADPMELLPQYAIMLAARSGCEVYFKRDRLESVLGYLPQAAEELDLNTTPSDLEDIGRLYESAD